MARLISTRFLAAIVAVLAFILSLFVAWADSPTPLQSYRTAISQSLALVEQANATPLESRAPLLTQATALLAAVQEVRLPSGSLVEVDNSSILSLLHEPNSTDKALERLRSLNTALSRPPSAVNADDQARLRDILSHPPFTATAQENLLAALWSRIQDFIERLLNQSARGILDIADLTVLLGLIVIVAVVTYFVRNLRRNIIPEEVLETPQEDGVAANSREAFAFAQHFAGIGDYRSAVRQLYLATLLSLDEHGRLRFDRSLTNREVLQEPSIAPPLAVALAPIVETFDRTWYGFEPITAGDFESYRRKVQALSNS